MIKLEYLENNELKSIGVVFRYDGDKAENGQFIPRITSCFLFDDLETEVAMGMAATHSLDQFKRVTGRKLAFKRALEVFTGRREVKLPNGSTTVIQGNINVRRQLWAAYLKKFRVR